MRIARRAPALFAAAVFTGCAHMTIDGGTVVINGNVVNGFSSQAKREDHLDLDIKAGDVLKLDSSFGTIDVEAGGGKPEITAMITIFAESEDDAKRLLEQTHIDLRREGDTVAAVAVTDDAAAKVERSRWGKQAAVSYKARVPAGVRPLLETKSGAVSVRGALGDTSLRSSFGSLRATGTRGTLRASTSSGAVTIDDAKGESVDVESSFGALQGTDLEAPRVSFKTSSGSVKIVRAAKATFSIQTSFGAIDVDHASGWLTAHTSSGRVQLDHFDGKVDASTSFGGVTVSGVLSDVTAVSQSGSMKVHAFPGSRMEAPWKIKTDFGSVTAVLPDSFDCAVDAETGFGSVSSSLQAEEEERSSKRQFAAKLGKGSQPMTLRSNSGSIRLERAGK